MRNPRPIRTPFRAVVEQLNYGHAVQQAATQVKPEARQIARSLFVGLCSCMCLSVNSIRRFPSVNFSDAHVRGKRASEKLFKNNRKSS
jgi:hypothetical protein